MNQFSEADIMLIKKEITRKSYLDIAFLLDKELQDLKLFLEEWSPAAGIISYQQLLDERQASRPVRIRKPRQMQEKKPKIISRIIENEQKEKRQKGREPKFQTKAVDYSQLQSVRVDQRTFIYIQAGDDPKKAIEKYHQTLEDYKHRGQGDKTRKH